jgi:SnoaL-like domain
LSGDPTPEERAALRELAERYAAGIDRRDTELFLSAFHPEQGQLFVFDPSEAPEPRGTRRGRDELADVITLIARYDTTFHMLGNSRYDVAGDTASGEVYCIAHHLDANPSNEGDARTDRVMFIRYRDEYGLGEQGWRIIERRVLVDWTETRRVEP